MPGHRLAQTAAFHATTRIGHYTRGRYTGAKSEGQGYANGVNEPSISRNTLIHSKIVYIR
jgi:hypothetical protein